MTFKSLNATQPAVAPRSSRKEPRAREISDAQPEFTPFQGVPMDHWCRPAKGPSPERSRSDGMLSRPVRQQPHAIHESCALSATEPQSAQMPITWLHRHWQQTAAVNVTHNL